MSIIDRIGTFRGQIVEKGLSETQKSGLPQYVCVLEATEYWDEENEQWLDWSEYAEKDITGYFVLVSKEKKPTLNADQLKKALGWSGSSLGELETMDTDDIIVQFRVVENTYNDKTHLQVGWIDHVDADPSRSLKKLDSDGVKALDAKYAAVFKKYGDPPKPKSAPEKPKKAAKPEPKEKPSKPTKKSSPPKPPKASKPPKKKKGEAVGAETLDLPGKCSEDEAWSALEKYLPEVSLEQPWFDAIEELGGSDAVDAEECWASVRDIVLERFSTQIVTE